MFEVSSARSIDRKGAAAPHHSLHLGRGIVLIFEDGRTYDVPRIPIFRGEANDGALRFSWEGGAFTVAILVQNLFNDGSVVTLAY